MHAMACVTRERVAIHGRQRVMGALCNTHAATPELMTQQHQATATDEGFAAREQCAPHSRSRSCTNRNLDAALTGALILNPDMERVVHEHGSNKYRLGLRVGRTHV